MDQGIMEHLAHDLGLPALAFKRANLYREGDLTHFDQKLVLWNVPRLIDEVCEPWTSF
jgi:xanthine dehydrogenase molybdopterin-binding subunit B